MLGHILLAVTLASSTPDLVVHAKWPAEATGTMHYAVLLRLEIGDARPLVIEGEHLPLPGPQFRLPDGRFLLLGWSSPGAGMESMHAMLISVRQKRVTLDRELVASTDRSSSGLLIRFAEDGSARIGLAEPEWWGSDEEMWLLKLGDKSRPLDFARMHRLRFEPFERQGGDVFYDARKPSKKLPRRVAWINVVGDRFVLAKPLTATGVPFKDPQFPVKVSRDIVYRVARVRAPSECDKEMTLDLFEPDASSAPAMRPGMVALHGGAFRAGGSRGAESFAGLCEEFAARGYVCASINYRLEPEEPHAPGETLRERTLNAALEDAADSVRWLIQNASAHRIDTDRIALAGRSAGAVMALRLACSPTGRALGIRALLDLSGSMRGALDSMQPGDPPVCIIHGTNDTLIPLADAQAVADRAAEVGVDHEFYFREGKRTGHIINLYLEIDGSPLLDYTVNFFYTYLNLGH